MVNIIKPKDNAEWLKIKEGTIGGSEMAVICHLNPYMSPYQLWLLKTKREQPSEPSLVMKRGNYFEDGLANMWADEMGHRLIKSSAANILYIDDEYPFLSVTPDRRFFHKEGGKRTLEVKTTFGRYDEPLDQWHIQLQWELLFTGHKFGELLWEFPDPRVCFKSVEIEANKELQSQLKEIAIQWWTDHVINDIEPELTTSEDVIHKHPTEEEGKIIEATVEVQEMYSEIKKLQSEIKPRDKKIEELKESVKMKMMDAEAINFANERLFSWKANKNGKRTFRIK